jgi:type II secretory ATPase GspE/PulE/Tfp pilus assembly ATPase PilB-like protein
LSFGAWRPVILSVAGVLLLPELALAALPFPRGSGFYFNLYRLLAVLALYLGWMRICWWVDQDADELGLSKHRTWNAGLLAAGAVGLLAVWMMDSFLLSFLLLLVLCLAPALAYVWVRNKLVSPDEQVLTPDHLRELARRYLKLNLGKRGEAKRGDKAIPLRFYSKSSGGRESETTVNRAQGSPGYRAALEMVYEALELRTTDIHMEPTKDEMAVRYRIDGILQAASPFSREMGEGVINIFKVLANLDITEKRKPQDGSFSGELTDRPKADPHDTSNLIDFRVATAGSVAGEKLVMRILDRSKRVSSLSQIGMRDKVKNQIHEIVTQPHGMLIVCGPTGAGKSTTLYAALGEIDCFQKNVITVENPVEYQIPNVTQIEINPKAGKTFAGELRSILRQDPDVIYIGEIRDNETAEIACQAAQTGHMVLTTLHANDTVTAIGRLLDLGVQPFLIANAVSAILGQRLVRVLCPKCKQRYKPSPEMIRKANLPADKIKFFYRPPESKDGEEGGETEVCKYCGGTGYRGRTGVFELLVLADKIKELIRENPNLNAIRQEAVKQGMKYLQEDGLRQVIEGETSIQELLRVCK